MRYGIATGPRLVTIAALIVAGVPAVAPAAVPLAEVVTDYMPDDLETAIVPTPRRAALEDVCHKLAEPVVCLAPETLVAAHRKLVEEKVFGMPPGRVRDRALRKLSASLKADGWPDPAHVALQLLEVLPDATVAAEMPQDKIGTLVVVTADGLADAPTGVPGRMPALPKVDDPDVAPEAYTVRVAGVGGRPTVVVRGASPWGMLWGLQTLRQMLFAKGDARYVRAGTVTDWPTFWFRGGKRGKEWWVRYKGNAAFGGEQWGFARHRLSRAHYWWVKGDSQTVDQLKTALAKAADAGLSCFIIDYNDGDFRTKDQPDERFPGDPARTVQYLLQTVAVERKRLGADLRIGYMPAAYSLGHGVAHEAGALKAIDALAAADVLLHNGLEVWTFRYPPAAADAYREAFGFRGDLILYDCQCLRKPLGAIDLENGEVWRKLRGLSMQNAWFLYAITGLDYAWNPAAYDPARSLKLATREWALRDPATYRALDDLVTYFNANDFIEKFLPRDKMIQTEKAVTRGMVARLEKLKPLLAEHCLVPGTIEFFTDPGINSEIGHRPMRRKLMFPLMAKHGFRECRIKRRSGEIVIDGTLDEAAWSAAAVMDGFTTPGYAIRNAATLSDDDVVVLPSEGRNVVARALYDDEAIYYAVELHGLSDKALTKVREALGKGLAEPALTPRCWRHGPTVEIYLDPAFAHRPYFQVLCTVPNEYTGIAQQHFNPDAPLKHWVPKLSFRYALSRDEVLGMECRLSYDPQITRPRPGDVWSVQLQTNGMFQGAPVTRWSFSYGTWSQAPYQRFGRWIFE